MSSIQDIRGLELRITDIVDDYVKKMYNEDDVLAIGRRCGKITIGADAREKIKAGKTRKMPKISSLASVRSVEAN